MHSTSRLLYRILFHGLGVLHHCFIIWTAASLTYIKYEDPTITIAMVYGPRYLTYWNFGFQLMFLAVSLRCDVAEWKNQEISKLWIRVRELIFHALVFPFTLYVFGTFWSLYALNREFVFPLIFDTAVPWWLNQAVHTCILAVLATEMMLQPRPYPKEGPYYKIFFVSVHLYTIVYYGTYFINGVWLYPFYNLLSWPLIVLWQVKFVAAFQILYEIQWPLFKFLYEDAKHTKPISNGKVKIKYRMVSIKGCNDD